MKQEQRLDKEWLLQKQEGKRRQREHEGIAVALNEHGKTVGFIVNGAVRPGCIGTRKLAGAGMPIGDGILFAIDEAESFSLYFDETGLEQELKDLCRDAERFEKSEGVRFE